MTHYKFNIFVGERYYATLHLKYPTGWMFTETQLVKEATDRFPALKHSAWHFA